MGTITWLHLSDLHFSAEQAHMWNEDIVLRALLDDVRQQAQDGLSPDLILVSGDVAFSGRPAEYELARAFFDDLLAATGLSKEALCLVPGNHDVDRHRIRVTARTMALNLTGRDMVNEVLGDKVARQAFLERFKGYAAFVKSYLGQAPFDQGHVFHVRPLNLAGSRVAVLALNSAWLAQGGDEDRLKLALGERQVRAALDAARDADLRLALLHHPFSWLHDFDRESVEGLLCRECDFVLHGHMHQVGLLQARTPDSNAFLVAAGACYDTRQYPNAYNYVRLDLTTGQGTVHLRTYSDRSGGFWTADTINYRNVSNGVYAFSLAEGTHPPVPAPAAGGSVVQTGPVMPGGNIPQSAQTVHQPVGPAPAAERPPAAPPLDTGGYNLQVVRYLLLAAFNAADLNRLFLYTSSPDLRELTAAFAPSDGLTVMVDKVIEFCLQRRLFPELEAEVKDANPRQYARYAGRLRET